MPRDFFYGLHIAIPKGSMEVEAMRLLNAGLAKRNTSITWRGYDGFISGAGVHRISKLRPQDSPVYVVRGGIDACITGEDCIKEQGLEDKLVEIAKIPLTRAGNDSVTIAVFADTIHTPWMESIEDLQQARALCGHPNPAKEYFREKDLDVQVSVYTPWMRDIQYLPKIKVVTEYPNIAKRYFEEKGIDVDIDVCHGACEAIVSADLAVLGVDVVDSGNTLEENRMRIIDTVMTSSAVFVTDEEVWSYRPTRAILQDFADMLLEDPEKVDG